MVHKASYASVHGPVLITDAGAYAIRYAGIGRRLDAITEWFRMNKARTLDEFCEAMRAGGIPMFYAVFADAEGHVF